MERGGDGREREERGGGEKREMMLRQERRLERPPLATAASSFQPVLKDPPTLEFHSSSKHRIRHWFSWVLLSL